jgi:hypothetical protein
MRTANVLLIGLLCTAACGGDASSMSTTDPNAGSGKGDFFDAQLPDGTYTRTIPPKANPTIFTLVLKTAASYNGTGTLQFQACFDADCKISDSGAYSLYVTRPSGWGDPAKILKLSGTRGTGYYAWTLTSSLDLRLTTLTGSSDNGLFDTDDSNVLYKRQK